MNYDNLHELCEALTAIQVFLWRQGGGIDKQFIEIGAVDAKEFPMYGGNCCI